MLEIDLNFFAGLEGLPRKERMKRGAHWWGKQGRRVLPVARDGKNLLLDERYASCDPLIIEQWFEVDFPEANISVELEPGVFTVIDIDRHGEIDGFKSMGLSEQEIDGVVVDTPHHGVHKYVTGEVIYKKTIPGVEHKTQRIIVPPSIVDGLPYIFRSGGEPGQLSSKMARALLGFKILEGGSTNVSSGKKKTFMEAAAQSTAPSPVAPIGYIQRLLEYMDPDCDYLEWSKIGMALHHNDEGDISKEAWDGFSQQSPKYKEGECDRKWESFSQNKSNVVTLRWLIRTAKERGCPDSPEDNMYYGTSLTMDMVVMRLNKTYIYRKTKSGNRVCWLQQNSYGQWQLFQQKESDWKGLMQNQYSWVGTAYLPDAEIWLRSPLRRSGEVDMWEVGKEPPGAMNLYQGFAVEPVPCEATDVQFFLDFTLDVVCRGNAEYQHYLLDLLAFKVQHPLELSGVCLVLQGGEGTGKGSLCRVMETIIGPSHTATVSQRNSLLGEYSGRIASAIWVTANEAIWAGHHGEAERLKAIITEPTVEWGEKFTPIWEQRNCIQLSMTTNNAWAVPADFDSRRIFMLRVSDDKKRDTAYWMAFNALLGRTPDWQPRNPDYMGKVLYFLQQRQITSDFTHALETEWLVQQRQETLVDSQEEAFVSWVDLFKQETASDAYMGKGGEHSFAVVQYKGKNCILAENMYSDYRSWHSRHYRGRRPFTKQRFNDALHRLGIRLFRVRKSTLTMGPSKFPGEPENKITIASLPTPNEFEAALSKHYPLLTDDIAEEEDDDLPT